MLEFLESPFFLIAGTALIISIYFQSRHDKQSTKQLYPELKFDIHKEAKKHNINPPYAPIYKNQNDIPKNANLYSCSLRQGTFFIIDQDQDWNGVILQGGFPRLLDSKRGLKGSGSLKCGCSSKYSPRHHLHTNQQH